MKKPKPIPAQCVIFGGRYDGLPVLVHDCPPNGNILVLPAAELEEIINGSPSPGLPPTVEFKVMPKFRSKKKILLSL